jgi:hypothetical protein
MATCREPLRPTPDPLSDFKECTVHRPTRILVTLALLTTLALPAPARAQSTPPKVQVVLKSADAVLKDIKLLLDLTSKNEQKQWNNVKDVIETFLFGIDPKKPVAITVILDSKEEAFHFVLPVSNLKDFIADNLEGFGYTVRKIGPTLYRLSENKKVLAFMRYQKGYATIDVSRNQVNAIFNPAAATAALLAKQQTLSATIKNSADGQEARRDKIVEIKKNLLAAIKPRKSETREQMALRRELVELQWGEAGRFFAESEALSLGFRIDPKTKQAHMDIDLVALPDTGLEKAVHKLANTPSHFANVARADDSILSFRINHPLDAFSRTGLQAVLAAIQQAGQAEIARTASATDAQKDASNTTLNTVVTVIQSTLAKGLLDAFIQVTPTATGAHVMVAGIRTHQGQQLRAALVALPNSTEPTNVQLDSETIGDVTIHVVTVPAKLRADFASIFGEATTLLVGTSDNAAWCAAGPGALEALKAAINEQAAQPAPDKVDPTFFDLAIKLRPWIQALDKRMGTEGEVDDRKLAIKAFAGGQDTLELKLQRVDNRVVGRTTLGTGVLRFLGKKVAEFSKENFE